MSVVTRQQLEDKYGPCPDFQPTLKVVVKDRKSKRILREDFIHVDMSGRIPYGYIPNREHPQYSKPGNYWQCLVSTGDVFEYPVSFHDIPPDEIPGWVYLIESGDNVKIGWSQDVSRRMMELQIANPVGLKLLGTVPGTKKDEFAYHAKFAHLNVTGEWFKKSDEILAILVERG
jgi:hypothetical protein